MICFSNDAFAQEIFDSSNIQEENAIKKRDSRKNFWDKHFQGSINFTYAGLDNYLGISNADRRGSAYIRLAYEDTWGPVKLVLKGRYLFSTLQKRYNVTDRNGTFSDTYDFRLDEKTEEFDTFLREAYLQFDMSPYSSLTIGKQLHTFGQFNIFSPIDFLLPFDVSDRSVKFNKVENRFPQLSLKLSFFTLNNVEINFIYFPSLASDTVFEFIKQNRQPILIDADFDRHLGGSSTLSLGFPTIVKPPHENTYALRIIHYASEITYGFTIFSGFSQFPLTKDTILPDGNNDTLHIIDSKRELHPLFAYGFELSKLIGDYEFKFEILYFENIFTGFRIKSNIYSFFVNDINYSQEQASLRDEVDSSQARFDYYNWIRRHNDSRLYLKTHSVNFALGFYYNQNDWVVNLSFIVISNFAHPDFEKGIALRDKAAPPEGLDIGGGLNADSIVAVPAMNFYRNFAKDNWDYQVGLGFGVLSVAFGISHYHTFIIKDNLKIILSLEFLSYFSDSADDTEVLNTVQKSNGETMSEVVARLLENPLSISPADTGMQPSIRLALSYSF